MPGASGIGRSDGADAQVYGLIVSGSGLVPYVDSSFRVESGMAPVELVVSSGQYSAGKATDDDCAFCDLFGTFNDQQEEEEDETPEDEEDEAPEEDDDVEEEEDEAAEEGEDEAGGGDLIVSASISDTSLTTGQAFTLTATVQNQGTDESPDLVLSYYRSSNATISTLDAPVGTDAVGRLAASEIRNESISLMAPSRPDTYYYGACVANVSSESDTPINCSTGVRVIVAEDEAEEEAEDEAEEEAEDEAEEEAEDEAEEEAEDEAEEEAEETDSTSSEGGPDLIVQAPSVSAVMLTPGQAFTLHVTVHNQGDGQAAATTLHYYRSSNTTITSSDTEVGTDAVGALDASATSASSIELTAPMGVSAEVGIYYGACVASVRGESNTDNNCSSAVRITVSGHESPEEEETEEVTEEEGDDTPVTIPDANLRTAIEAALGKASGAPITVAEMKTLNSLDAPNFTNGLGIRDLTGLESATNLIELDLPYNTISDLSPLSGLTNLTNLNLRYNTISDLSPLSGLTNLTNLDLTEVKGSLVQGADRYSPLDLSPLSDLANLTNLDLGQNKISDLSPLAGLTNLTNLNLASIHAIWDESNPPPPLDLSPLSGLTNLTNLNLAYNNISDISALSGLINLINLDLSQNKIADISALAGLTELREVFLSVNNISDLAPLSANTGLGSGDIVDVKTNPLNDASIITHISAFQARGVRVSFDEVIALTGPADIQRQRFCLARHRKSRRW